jgi:prepilin signal peptidase PulO-like enzyme (type II secretory pathway)
MEQIFGLILAMAFGAVFGSYATLFAYRLPRKESCFGRYFGQKSRCPQCNAIIKTRDLIPLLNWIITFGRCRSCQTKIPRIHLFVEVATTALFAICYLKFSFTEEFIIYAMISVGLVILLACDFTHKLFPQSILIFIMMAIIANRTMHEQSIIGLINSGAIGIICSAVFYHIFYKKTEGLFATQEQSFDYTKFIIIAALALNVVTILFYFFAVMALLTILLLLKIPNRGKNISFGYVLIIPFILLLLNSSISL